MQRGDEAAIMPGGERANDYSCGSHSEERVAAAGIVLNARRLHSEEISMVVNDPETVAELRALYPRYEEALVSNDVEVLTQMFWASPLTIRFGAGENLYGIDQIEMFRKSRPAANLARRIVRLEIVTFGKDFGSVTLEFERDAPEATVLRGRQSQVWVRFQEGWRIVSAHVSTLPAK